jgi:hypothetical protein
LVDNLSLSIEEKERGNRMDFKLLRKGASWFSLNVEPNSWGFLESL